MKMKTVTITEETWKELTLLKMELNNASLNETIKYLLYELNKEEK